MTPVIPTARLRLNLESTEAVDQRGRGYAKEAATALAEFAFAAGARLVRAHTRLDNDASARVLVASGFERVGQVVDAEDGLVALGIRARFKRVQARYQLTNEPCDSALPW